MIEHIICSRVVISPLCHPEILFEPELFFFPLKADDRRDIQDPEFLKILENPLSSLRSWGVAKW